MLRCGTRSEALMQDVVRLAGPLPLLQESAAAKQGPRLGSGQGRRSASTAGAGSAMKGGLQQTQTQPSSQRRLTSANHGPHANPEP